MGLDMSSVALVTKKIAKLFSYAVPVNPELSILSSIRQKLNRDSKANLWEQIVRTLDDADECFYHPVHCRLVVSCVVTCQFTIALANVNQTPMCSAFFLLEHKHTTSTSLLDRKVMWTWSLQGDLCIDLTKLEQSVDCFAPDFL